MKNKISFLAIIAFALNANCVRASECVDDECELTPIEISENVETYEVLAPVQYTVDWVEPVMTESTCEIANTCEHDYNCPFDSKDACAIWYKKPAYKTAVAPRTPHLNPALVDNMIYSLYSYDEMNANNPDMAPLVQRYKMLMNASDACCTAGIVYKMRQNGADDGDVYEFLKDDANRFAVTKRCMVMSDEDITSGYSHGVTGQMVADVRNACLCKNKQWFDTLLQPFNDMYYRVPDFAESAFMYSYIDGMGREINVSVNEDVQNTMGLLEVCPK